MSCCGGLNTVVPLTVPGQDQTDGPAADVSSLVGTKSIEISGDYVGEYVVLGSHDGVKYGPLLTFNSGAGVQSFRQTTDYTVRYLRVRRRATNTSVVRMSVAAKATCDTNNFLSLTQIGVGTGVGPLPSVDLWSLVPSTGLDDGFTVMCFGDYEGTIAIEGSIDGTQFAPVGIRGDKLSAGVPSSLNDLIGGFSVGPRPTDLRLQSTAEQSPLIVDNTVRYFRARVAPGTIVRGTVTITIGGAQNNDCDSGSGDLPTPGSTLYYLINPQTGNDATGAPGTSRTLAALTPWRTYTGWAADFPRDGNDSTAIVGFVPVTGGSSYGETFAIRALIGYRRVMIEGTDDFSGDTTDRVKLGAVPATGTNAAGYNATRTQLTVTGATNAEPIVVQTSAAHNLTTGDVVNITGITGNTGANGCWQVTVTDATHFSLDDSRGTGTYAAGGTVNVWRLTLNGGGAPALPAEGFAGISGMRMRFAADTTTAALRNVTSGIYMNGTDTVCWMTDPSTAPTGTDVLLIEQPGVILDGFALQTSSPVSIAGIFANGIVQISGPETGQPELSRFNAPALQLAFFYGNTAGCCISGMGMEAIGNYPSDDGATAGRNAGMGFRLPLLTCTRMVSVRWEKSASLGNASGSAEIRDATSIQIGQGCILTQGIDISVTGGNPFEKNNSLSNSVGVGNQAVASSKRVRFFGAGGSHGGTLNLYGTNAYVYGVQFQVTSVDTNDDSDGLISVHGANLGIFLDDVVGAPDASGTWYGLDLRRAWGCTIITGKLADTNFGPPGVSNILDVVFGSPQGIITGFPWTSLAITNAVDPQGNDLQGAAGKIVSSSLAYMQTGAAVVQYSVARSSGTTNEFAPAQADSAADAAGVVGVCITIPGEGGWALIVPDGNVPILCVAAPDPGDIIYLSTASPGRGQVAIPPAAATNQKLRLGIVGKTPSGNIAIARFTPEILPVTADGNA